MIGFDNTLKAIIICHGKSECILTQSLKSNLRLPVEIVSEKKGEKSIQITSIIKFLNKKPFKNKRNLIKEYPRIRPNSDGTFSNFYIFIIMDIDEKELTSSMIEDYKTKKMFKHLDYCDYIIPIYNNKNLDEVMESVGYLIDRNNKVSSYQKIFPGTNGDVASFLSIKERLKKSKNSNMIVLLDYLERCFINFKK